MSKVAGSRKRKVTNRTINEEYKILKEVDKGETRASLMKKLWHT